MIKKDDINKYLKNIDKVSIEELVEIIQKANVQYYTKGKPFISDEIYDLFKEQLEKKDPKNPILKEIGARVEKNKVDLPSYLGSLDKIKDDEKALNRFVNQMESSCSSYIISEKLDGLSGLLKYYADGSVKLFTRGNGLIGQDISHLIPFLKIPIHPKEPLEIRGELIIKRKVFEEKLKDKGVNARNMVAGVINSKTPDLGILKFVDYVVYELIYPSNKIPQEQLKFLESKGFSTVKWSISNILSFENLSDKLVKMKEESEYEIDGIVVTHNSYHERNKDGNPNYSFAFKSVLSSNIAETTVIQVEWNISKDGYLKPVIIIDPVFLTGTTIKRVTGFNGKFIKDNNIGPGAKIVITRSGDVIPHVMKVSKPSEAQMPEMSFKWNDTGVDIMIDADADLQDTSEYDIKQLNHFFDKIDIPGLSIGTIKTLYNNSFNTVKSILDIKISDLLEIDGFKVKKATNLYEAIDERKKKGFECILLMTASNKFGRGIGQKKIELISMSFPSILDPSKPLPTESQLVSIKGIEKKTAQQFLECYEDYKSFIKENNLMSLILLPKHSKTKDTNKDTNKDSKNTQDEKYYVFSGFRDKELESWIKDNLNGKVVDVVTKKVNGVIVKSKDKTTTKTEKATTFNIPILTVEELKQKSR